MDEQLNDLQDEPTVTEPDPAENALYEKLCSENKALLEELEQMRSDMRIREELEQGKRHLRQLVGQNGDSLYEQALKKAQMEEFSALPYEKRCELGYLLCLGEEAHRSRGDGKPKETPPRFAASAGNGQVMLSAENRPTSFAMAKENAKRYLNLKY